MRNGILLLLVTVLMNPVEAQRTRRARPSGTSTDTAVYKNLAGTFHGTVKQLDKKEITIQTEGDQTVTIRLSRKTKFLKDGQEIKRTDIDLNARVSVDAREDVDLKPIAVAVAIDSAPPKAPDK